MVDKRARCGSMYFYLHEVAGRVDRDEIEILSALLRWIVCVIPQFASGPKDHVANCFEFNEF